MKRTLLTMSLYLNAPILPLVFDNTASFLVVAFANNAVYTIAKHGHTYAFGNTT